MVSMQFTNPRSIGLVLLLAVVMVATFAFYAFFAREVTHWIEGEHHWFHDYEPWSLLGFVVAFLFSTAMFLPAQPFVVATGYLFGFHFLTVIFLFSIYTLAAFLMFNGARYWFRPAVEQWLREHRLVEGMAQYVKDPKEGAKVNLLFSFTPLAFCLHCYTMGITEINEHVFLVTFLIGQSPHIFFGVLTGSAMLAAETNSFALDWFKIAMLSAGILGTFVAVIYLGSIAQEVLEQMDDGISNDRLLAGPKQTSRLCGIGITFEEGEDRSLVVRAIAPGSPAHYNGIIRVGDILHEVDGRLVHRADIKVILHLIPGNEGSKVELGLKRGISHSDPLYRVTLERKNAVWDHEYANSPATSPDDSRTPKPWQDANSVVGFSHQTEELAMQAKQELVLVHSSTI